MDNLDAITLFCLLQNSDGQASLLECAKKFQETKDALSAELKQEQDGLNKALDDGTFAF